MLVYRRVTKIPLAIAPWSVRGLVRSGGLEVIFWGGQGHGCRLQGSLVMGPILGGIKVDANLELQGQPFFNGCLVISNHFSCKDLVHHPIETTILKWMAIRFQEYIVTLREFPKIKMHGSLGVVAMLPFLPCPHGSVKNGGYLQY